MRKLRLSNIGRKVSEEERGRRRESRLSQVFPPQDNKFELAMQSRLREKGIEFETHRMYIKRGLKIYGQPDIFIKPNLCIFLDGDYFHANPSKYPDDFILWRERISKRSGRLVPARTAKMIRERDEQVNKELRTQGYSPERIWLSEFKKDPEKCIQKIIKAIKESVHF